MIDFDLERNLEAFSEEEASKLKTGMQIKLNLLNVNCALKQLHKLPNPFESLHMISCSNQETKDSWVLFTQFGEQEDVSEYLTPQGCSRYKSYYDARFKKKSWWNSEKVWKGMFRATKAVMAA